MIEPVLTEISKNVLAKRYLIRNEKQEVIESPQALFQRVARFIASAEASPHAQEIWTKIFYTMMASCDFEPNTPCLVNAGRPDGTGQLSACFVIPVPDSMDGIFTAMHDMAMVQKTGGGTGFSFSRLRPEGDFVNSTSGIASGPISFMEVFDFATERIKQGGVRRGANMGILRVDHPDIMKFIKLKQNRSKMQNFNVSVAITDAFMLALASNSDYDLIHPVDANIVGKLNAREVWDAIIYGAWFIGDPGLVFIDRINKADPLSAKLGPVEATNPCQPAWATVLTPEGVKTFADIDVDSVIWSGFQWTKVTSKVATGVKPVYAYRTRGGTFYGTENHRIVQGGKKIEVRDAKLIDIAELPRSARISHVETSLTGAQEIIGIQAMGTEPVFDITVEAEEHTYWTDGLLVSNCGEVPLRPYDACCLGSINLSKFYIEKVKGTDIDGVSMRHGSIDFDRLKTTARAATRFLDNMLTVNRYPIPQIGDVTSKSRKIGLGVMGWADLLIKLGIPYASEEARTLARHVMGAVDRWAVEASEELAGERGPFHHWPDSSWARDGQKPRRHSTATVIAPTGTISMIAGCSSGIEPEFALSMTRDQAGMIMHEVHPLVEEVARREGFWSDELAETVKATGSLATAPGVPDHWRAVFAIANELDMEAHIGMQSAFQQYTQDAVSKTINLKNDASMADVERAYMLAWTNNCKGITVYRDGCRDHQVLTAGVKTDATATIRVETEAVKTVDGTPAPSAPVPHVYPRRRIPADGRRKGETLSRSTSFGTAHVTINEHPDDQQPFELFARLGKSGAEVMAWAEAFGRTVSYALSMESPVAPSLRLEAIANQLVGIGGSNYGFGETRVDSAPDAIGKTMLTYLGKNVPEENAQPVYNKTAATSPKDLCPECGQATLVIGGTGQRCGLCTSCGYSNCG